MAPVANAGVTITNLAEFRRDLKAAESGAARELTKALKVAGLPLIAEIAVKAPVGPSRDPHPGQLRGGYGISVAGTTAQLTNKAPYGPGAEWGQRGKWSGFMKYGAPGRFGWVTVEEHRDDIAERIYEGIQDLVTLHGWAGT